MGYDVTIVLCTVNEVKNLPILVRKIEENAKFDYELVFEDGGSTDGTREFIMEYARNHQNVGYFFYPNRRSLLIAEYSGYKHSNGSFIIKMDADLQHPGEKLSEIYEKLNEGYDIVVASRYVDGGSTGRREPLRGLVSRLAEFYAKLFLAGAKKTTDPLSGYFGFKRGLKLEVNERWRGYKSLLFLLSSNPDAKVKDVPYKFLERADGTSKIVGSAEFMRIYLSEIILAKRLEVKNRKRAT